MKKKIKPSKKASKGFDERFDVGEESVDFSAGSVTGGLSKTIKLPPLDIPAWVSAEIESLARFQANSKAAIVRQLLVDGIEARKRRMAS